MYRPLFSLLSLLAVTLLSACGAGEEPAKAKTAGVRAIPITVTQSRTQHLAWVDHSVGQVETQTAPVVAAEVKSTVARILADVGKHVQAGEILARLEDRDLQIERRAAQAEIRRLDSLLDHQRRQVERYHTVGAGQFISPALVEEAEAQLHALEAQQQAAQARLQTAERALTKTEIRAPVTGQIERRLISVGDFVDPGTPLFHLATRERLRIHLPFPETIADQLRPGLAVTLHSPGAPGQTLEGVVSEVLPLVGAANRSVSLVVHVDNPGAWQPGASVLGSVILREYPDAVTVPETSVVRRPQGEVVYLIADGKAQQQVVVTGLRRDGVVQITSGLAAGAAVALDGAAYLTDGAPVAVQEPRR